ncbi:MAG TPA: DUF4920 domain-containing protein [Salinimicrobium sp.]|nr:DUF4920 domain-containing protein [Salinimicrobium sp.]
MKKYSIVLVLASLLIFSCKEAKEEQEVSKTEVAEVSEEIKVPEGYLSVGEKMDTTNVLSMAEMEERYKNLPIGDTINVKYETTVKEVCKKKGCWMIMENGESDDVMVKFKDYAFFVPKDIDSSKVIISGKAYVTEMSVEDRQHYAEDGGKSEAEIAAITEPKKTLSFLADGVLIKE